MIEHELSLITNKLYNLIMNVMNHEQNTNQWDLITNIQNSKQITYMSKPWSKLVLNYFEPIQTPTSKNRNIILWSFIFMVSTRTCQNSNLWINWIESFKSLEVLVTRIILGFYLFYLTLSKTLNIAKLGLKCMKVEFIRLPLIPFKKIKCF